MSDQESELHVTSSLSSGEWLKQTQDATDIIVHPPTPVAPPIQYGSTQVPSDLARLLYCAQQAVREAGLNATFAGDAHSPWLIATSETAVVVVACTPIDQDSSRALVFAASSDGPVAENARNQVRSAIDRLAAEVGVVIDHPEQGLEAEPG